MADYTLVLIDVQDKFLNDLCKKDRERVIAGVTREIRLAREAGQGIVVCEYDVEKRGRSADFVLEALKGYNRYLQFEHSGRSIGREVLAVARQQRYGREGLRVCGLYRKTSVEETVEECRYCTNYQLPVEIVDDGCADLGRPFSLSIG